MSILTVIIIIIIALTGLAFGAFLLLSSWLLSMFTLTICILELTLKNEFWEDVLKVFLAGIISITIGGCFALLIAIFKLQQYLG